jgi:uncharacterized protein YggU (UPF0235/DUF167 family)
LLSKYFDSRVRIVSGLRSREKVVEVENAEENTTLKNHKEQGLRKMDLKRKEKGFHT